VTAADVRAGLDQGTGNGAGHERASLRHRLAERGIDRTLLLALPGVVAIIGLFFYPFLYGLQLSFQPKTGGFFGAYKAVTSIRVSPEAEVTGLDLPEFGVPGYAGFVMEQELHGDIPPELIARAMAPRPPVAAQPAGGGS